MSWNYRLVKTEKLFKTGQFKGKTSIDYSIREVYYNKFDQETCMTTDPICFGETEWEEEITDTEAKEYIIKALKQAIKDIKNQEIFIEPNEWAEDDITLEGTIRVKDKEGKEFDYFCPHCKGIVIVWYTWDNKTNQDFEYSEWEKDKEYSCYKCNKRVNLEELNLEEIKKDND